MSGNILQNTDLLLKKFTLTSNQKFKQEPDFTIKMRIKHYNFLKRKQFKITAKLYKIRQFCTDIDLVL